MDNNDIALLKLIQFQVSGRISNFPRNVDWQDIMDKSFRQGVGGIAFDALENVPESLRPSKNIFYAWLGQVVVMERLYAKNKASISHLASFFQKNGVKMLLLKGYGLSLYWPNSCHRPVGDIDIYNFGRQAYADEILKKYFGIKIDNSHHKHSVFAFEDAVVENHYNFLNVYAHRSTAVVEQILHNELCDMQCSDIQNVIFPSVRFNSLYILRHSAEHFASVDINLRIVLDWGFFVKANTVDWEWLIDKVDQVGMTRYLAILNAICINYLGFEKSRFPNLPEDKTIIDRCLKDILSPKEESDIHYNNIVVEIAFRFKRWWNNRWKHDIVFKENLLLSFVTQVWSHLLKPAL